MPSVRELSDLYGNFLLSPRRGPDVCLRCFNFTDGYDLCYACTKHKAVLDVVAPISYSVAHEQLHHALASYKRLSGEASRRLVLQLAAVLWRYLNTHEDCVAQAGGVASFPLVTTVPSGDRERDERHPLRTIVGELVVPTRDRHKRILRRSTVDVSPRGFAPDKYVCPRQLRGEAVLLIDDTWTTGANAQSAAATLKQAGAGCVAAIVLGRHVSRDWHRNGDRLRSLTKPFAWDQCALCAETPAVLRTGRQNAPA